ncbi:MAG: prolipoprotein diacylglyceryl transferase [Nitrospinae bacterium]|nr:prolipoprotein diacylglyceryl transferase [Nitrospinota bacterium]
MHPILFELGPVTLHTYGLMVAAGFLFGITLAARLGQGDGLDPQKVFDTCFWIVVAAIIGSRLVYIGVNLDHFVAHPLDVVKLWEGGLVFYGGFLGAIVAGWICVNRYKMDKWVFADVAAPGAALGHIFGRFGCFFAGCCYGKPTDVPWAVTFSDVASIAPTGVPLHPTQLYDALNELIIFAILMAVRGRRSFKGQIFFLWIMLYAIGRFIVEGFRGDPRGVWFGELISTSQLFALIGFAVGLAFYLRNRKKFPILVV